MKKRQILTVISTALAFFALRPAAAQEEPATQPPGEQGRDFIAEVRQLMRVSACSEDPLPEGLPAKIIDKHCQDLTPVIQAYRENYLPKLRQALQAWPLGGAPDVVVYPFGGGDLLSALAVYPGAQLITTISLEHSGDPRWLRQLTPKQLEDNLRVFFRCARGLLRHSDSKTESLMKLQQNGLAGELSLFLLGLQVHGKEPVWVRYFRLEQDGSLHYYSEEEIEQLEKKKARIVRAGCSLPAAERAACRQPDFSLAFSNVEIAFRDRGREDQPPQVFRHLAADLSDANIPPALLAYLESLGRVSAMTKAASYLLWRPAFSRIRDYLLKHMEVMVSDSTGIPPSLAGEAGFAQLAAGQFECSLLKASPRYNQEFRKLWQSSGASPLNFRFGYIDCRRHNHLLVTYKNRQENAPSP
jgi:hypothetical protein